MEKRIPKYYPPLLKDNKMNKSNNDIKIILEQILYKINDLENRIIILEKGG